MSSLLEGFAGTTAGSFFKVPDWVDASKPPGATPQATRPWLSNLVQKATAIELFYSPNLIWLLVAVGMYVLFPYDYEAAASFRTDFIVSRLILNSVVTFAYFGFWHVVLYVSRWSQRKFRGRRVGEGEWSTDHPGFVRTARNVWYCFLGVLQWTFFEVAMVNLYATGKLPHMADADILASTSNTLTFAAGVVLVPVFRSFHFYFAHRFLHIRALYKYVHSLHHRNVDIEPFSGLCMHPIEHLYYFACIAPSLWLFGSPFHMLWNGVHLLISPAASHSGWEDHFQSDQHHFLHHANFECNYGTGDLPLDSLFGTFRDRDGSSKTYQGEWTEKDADKSADKTGPVTDPFDWADLLPKSFTHGLYNAFGLFLCFACWACYSGRVEMTAGMGRVLAVLVSVGPVVVAIVLAFLSNDRLSIRWPFHKEPVIGRFGFHLVVSSLLTALPVYHMVLAAFVPVEETAYCSLWGCN